MNRAFAIGLLIGYLLSELGLAIRNSLRVTVFTFQPESRGDAGSILCERAADEDA